MPRMARLVVPGYPHHITQRGVRSMNIFSDDQDRLLYLKYLAEEADRFGVIFYAWCLMTNHVHLIAIPEEEKSLARAIGEAHRRYTRMKNFSEGVRGYLFQGRFGSCVLDQQHLLAAGRYVERNPVAAAMAENAEDYLWSSSRFHCGLIDEDPLVKDRILPSMVDNWRSFIAVNDDNAEHDLKSKTKTGRPAGGHDFVSSLEVMVGRVLHPKKAGRSRNCLK